MSFAQQVEAWAKKAVKREDVVVRELVSRGYSLVTNRSPVKTSAFRGAWNIRVGSPDKTVPFGRAVGSKSGSGLTGAESAYLAASTAGIRAGRDVYLSNNTGYAGYLERGSSAFAPIGVLKITALQLEVEWGAIVQSAISRVP